jgi:hypothetical protein
MTGELSPTEHSTFTSGLLFCCCTVTQRRSKRQCPFPVSLSCVRTVSLGYNTEILYVTVTMTVKLEKFYHIIYHKSMFIQYTSYTTNVKIVLLATSFGSGFEPSSGLIQEQRYRKLYNCSFQWW